MVAVQRDHTDTGIGIKTVQKEGQSSLANLWEGVAQSLKQELGDGPFTSYVAPCALVRGDDNDVWLVSATTYARDWIARNVLTRARHLWQKSDPLARLLRVKSRADIPAETLSDLQNSAKSAQTAAPAPQMPTTSGDCDPAPMVESLSRPISRVAGLQDRLTFDSFVVGPANQFAFETAKKVAAFEDGPFNPIFFHGPYGQGKTHLINAIAWHAQNLRPNAKIVYLTAEKFASTFARAIMDRATLAFKDEIRSADLLLIDDVHFIGGKTSSQEELFHTLTALIETQKRIVFTADRPPALLTEVEVRLRSYFAAGLVCGLEAADNELKMGIIDRKLKQLQRRLGLAELPKAEIYHFLADKVPGSIRELEGAVNTLVASAGARLGSLSVSEAMQVLSPNLKVVAERRITVDEIQKVTADYFGLKQLDLLSERRTRAVARPRQVAMWLCKKHTTRSFPDIGRRFGGRDHTTVLHAVKKIDELMIADEQMTRDIEALTRRLRNG